MYQIFEITLKPTQINLEKSLEEFSRRGWLFNSGNLVKTDDGLEYVLDPSHLSVKCFVGELFPIEEGEWTPENYPGREEIIRIVTNELERLPFNLEVDAIHRIAARL